MTVEIVTRESAIEQGLKYYYTDQPCQHGHRAQRRVNNRNCMECARNRYESGRNDGKKYNPNSQNLNSLPMPVLDDTRLSDLSRASITSTGINPDVKLTLPEWQSCCEAMAKVRTAHQWIVGDLYNLQETGSKAAYMESVGINIRSAQAYGQVAKRFSYDMRRPNLSFSHHRAIYDSGTFTDDAAMINALDHLDMNSLSVAATKKWLRPERITTRMVIGPVSDLRKITQALDELDTIPGEAIELIEQLKNLMNDN